MVFVKSLGGGHLCSQTILMIHGFMGDHRDFLPFAEHLAHHKRQIVLVDLPGHGSTPLPEDLNTDFDQVAEDIWLSVARVAQADISILGYSLGGRVACRIKSLYPDEVKTLVLESASFGLEDPDERSLRLKKDSKLFDRVLSDKISFADFLDIWYRLPLFQGLQESPGYQPMLERRLSQKVSGIQGALKILSVAKMTECAGEAKSWPGELHFISGRLDKKYREISNSLGPRWQTYVINDVSHNVHLQASSTFSSLLDAIFG